MLCVLGTVWLVGLSALAIPLLFLPGPGLLLLLFAGAGSAPWLALWLKESGMADDDSIPTQESGGGWPQQPGLPRTPAVYASFRLRLRATMWDVIYCWPALAGLLLFAVLLSIGVPRAEAGQSDGPVLIGAALLTFVVAECVLAWRHIRNYVLDQGRTGYTYGKRKVGIRLVRDVDGHPAGAGSALAKFLIRSVLVWLDVLVVLFDARRRCLGDMAVSTVVVVRPAR